MFSVSHLDCLSCSAWNFAIENKMKILSNLTVISKIKLNGLAAVAWYTLNLESYNKDITDKFIICSHLSIHNILVYYIVIGVCNSIIFLAKLSLLQLSFK